MVFDRKEWAKKRREKRLEMNTCVLCGNNSIMPGSLSLCARCLLKARNKSSKKAVHNNFGRPRLKIVGGEEDDEK